MGVVSELLELTVGLRGRRPDAWERLYTLTHLPLLRILRRALGDPGLAEEALQATYLTAIERIGTFDPHKGTVDAWISGIARHKAQEAARERPLVSAGEALADRVEARVAPPDAPGNGAGGEAELVALALDQLEPRYAEVLRRKYLAGEDLEGIARALSLKKATVGTLLHRGRERFRQVYERLSHQAEMNHGTA